MTLVQQFRTVTWLVRDTFRQSLAHGIFWVLAIVSVVCITLCASVTVNAPAALADPGENADFLPRNDPDARDRERAAKSGVTIVEGTMTLGFGAIELPVARDARRAVHFLQLLLACGVADTCGLLLALVWTAGFLPSFLDGRNIAVLLAKPASRWLLACGKFVGVLGFVLAHAVFFVGGTWLALGLKTGIWDAIYLWSVPLLLVHFAIFFSFSMLLAVSTRSTVICIFGSIVFWLVCWGMNFGRHAVLAESYPPAESRFSGRAVALLEAGYWTLPKPADLGIVLYDALEAADSFTQNGVFQIVKDHGDFHPWCSLAASLAFMFVLLAASSRQFATLDY
ncbi:MAG TPA: ABC transporter permease subunit [Pirellulales bacterium]|nr:ABC transporter permease subunit [Pirellulales bacterium]